MMSEEAQLAHQRWLAKITAEERTEDHIQRLRIVEGLVSILAETMTTETMITYCILRANADPRLTREMIDAVKPKQSHSKNHQ